MGRPEVDAHGEGDECWPVPSPRLARRLIGKPTGTASERGWAQVRLDPEFSAIRGVSFQRNPPGDDRGMDSSGNGERQRELNRIERYREVSVSALGQFEWIVGYLNEIHRLQIARALDRNRQQIRERVQAGR
jgi:hypothetical protein